ncbi:methyl-accepting chemotaxis protein [Burkholderia thailandensis]|uniref:Methyl-accepting chemotaxis (MCP) signaling domain protein n=2 Tax=Burkholderia thailandensis TaxID=57975 RepID=A0AAW9D377_BURTH|nr:methyl-accepting chemotaxis protein [Burkholderia thailandensis]ABC39064.1 methyl-accepting chemotaxis protein [Burkholderia thailandensis E264]AHI65019.1 methyl-accepting chemotaxis (MCP) signaling domain protein [Burkholderia thailandensis H0587]AHI77258.1 methyl-accepting chemotaxis (MCP) signaling domain protein [Burkholderia thailandensis E444]AIC85702.1 methyl-accepting chemotaxis (MCP) signaling domain protein [Burkholderia thailandensis USAMRU Malaysia \
MNFQKMTVGAKLATAFGALVGLVLLVSVLALHALGDANDRFASYVSGISARAEAAEEVRTAVDRRAIAARNLVLVTKPADVELEKAAVTQAEDDVQTQLRRLKELIANAPDSGAKARSLVADIDRVEAQYGPVALAIVNAALNNRHDEAITMMNDQCRPLLAQLVKATNAYSEYTRVRAQEMVRESADHYASQRLLLLALCSAAIGAAAIAAILIARGLTRALGAEPATLGDVTRRVANGDLSPVAGAQSAPSGSVLASMGEMQASLVRLIGQVRTAADSIATGSSQIASGNQDLSSRTEHQASSLQETASSMEELTSTVRQNAENAQQASSLAANASEVAQKGSAVVGQVVDTMTDISQSSEKVAEITGIIEGIAFQTNILALNAAVEAARAGEQGRGFAVVASEVRSLAQRSSSAAKEIKDLISASVQKIHDGSGLASEAGKTMTEVTQAVARVTDIMGEIAAASGEQSRGIEQVNQAIAQMDEVTQQNAALVEEAAAASKSLEEQGRQLTQAVSFFRANTDGAAPQMRHAADTPAKPGAKRGVAMPAPRPPRAAPTFGKPAALAVAAATASMATTTSDDWQTF